METTKLQDLVLYALQTIKHFHDLSPKTLSEYGKKIAAILENAYDDIYGDPNAADASDFIAQARKLVKYIGELEALQKKKWPNMESLTAELYLQCDIADERDGIIANLEFKIAKLKGQPRPTKSLVSASSTPAAEGEHEEALRAKDELINELGAKIEQQETARSTNVAVEFPSTKEEYQQAFLAKDDLINELKEKVEQYEATKATNVAVKYPSNKREFVEAFRAKDELLNQLREKTDQLEAMIQRYQETSHTRETVQAEVKSEQDESNMDQYSTIDVSRTEEDAQSMIHLMDHLNTGTEELAATTTKLHASEAELKLRVDEQKLIAAREPLFEVGVAVRRYFLEQIRLYKSASDPQSDELADDTIIKAGKRAVRRGNYGTDSSLFHLNILNSSEDLAHFQYIYESNPTSLIEQQTVHSRLIQRIFSYKGTFKSFRLPEDAEFDLLSAQTASTWVLDYKKKVNAPGGYASFKDACEAFDNDPDVLAKFEKMEERLLFLLLKK